jgi:hypothetical protein
MVCISRVDFSIIAPAQRLFGRDDDGVAQAPSAKGRHHFNILPKIALAVF